MRGKAGFLLFLLTAVAATAAQSEPSVGHEIDLLIDPARGTLAASDVLTLPADRDVWTLLLHAGMNPRVAGGDARLERIRAEGHLERYRLRRGSAGPVTLSYGGRIRHGLEDLREGMGRSRQWTRGTIGEDGAMLDGFSGWYPRIDGALHAFRLSVRLPPGWSAVSQGAGPEIAETPDGVRIGWRETQPQDEIHLVAAPFERYSRPTRNGDAQVYLRQPDPALAERYLDATADYLELYSQLIGPYPYAKFALVENFWETGYGMPSFTLLGPRVIRLPFILESSYPHEIAHNWWGNGVYVDYEAGNWSEGLTAYLADHLIAEQKGRGEDYRRDSLKSYADYVRDGEDFPIRAFRGRHGSASQAIGYGKTLMVLHMLRRDLGDPVFLAGLRRFYRDNRFRPASFDDLRRAFEQESGRDLADFFEQWTARTGSPEIALSEVSTEPSGEGFRLSGRVEQIQGEAPYPLTLPLVVHLANGETAEHRVPLAGRANGFDLRLAARPLRVAADPRFDLFRRLAPGESPATLSALFGAKDGLILLPSAAPPELARGYRQLAAAWARGSEGWEVTGDDKIDSLPTDRPVWLLGWGNRFLAGLAAGREALEVDPESTSLRIDGETHAGKDISAALVLGREGHPAGWAGASDPAALPGLTRKLPHYGKYSYLVFEGQEPVNRLKGQWSAGDSRLTAWLTEERPALEIAPRAPLTALLE